jgi:hypothetical protein
MFAVDENINLTKEDTISEEDNVFDEDSIRDSPILEFKSFTKNEVENVKREVENEYMSKAYMIILNEILKLRDLNDKLLLRLDDGNRQANLKDWELNEIIIQTLQEILDEKSKVVIPEEMFQSFNAVQESPTNSKIKEEVTEAVAEELSEVDDPISKLENMKEDLTYEIKQLVEEAEVTTSKFEQKQIEEKLETVVTKVEVVNTFLNDFNEEVDSSPLPPLIPSPKPS